jgi:hypothetical protein
MSNQTSNIFRNEIQNRNFLSPLGYKLTLNRSPKTAFFANTAEIPGISLGIANHPNYLRDIPVPGDKMEFDDFTFRFLVDENLENYMEIQNWMRGLGFPESLGEIYKLQKTNVDYTRFSRSEMNLYSDGTLLVLTSSENANFKVIFKGLFPYELSSLRFDSTSDDIEYLTAEVKFKYMMYNIVDKVDEPLHPL